MYALSDWKKLNSLSVFISLGIALPFIRSLCWICELDNTELSQLTTKELSEQKETSSIMI